MIRTLGLLILLIATSSVVSAQSIVCGDEEYPDKIEVPKLWDLRNCRSRITDAGKGDSLRYGKGDLAIEVDMLRGDRLMLQQEQDFTRCPDHSVTIRSGGPSGAHSMAPGRTIKLLIPCNRDEYRVMIPRSVNGTNLSVVVELGIVDSSNGKFEVINASGPIEALFKVD